MTKTFEDAQKGDRVWSPFGPEVEVGGTNGEITEILKGTPHAITRIRVAFDNINFLVFTQNGLFASTDSFPTLFWSRPEIKIPEKPRRMKKVKVKVRPRKLKFDTIHLRTDTYLADNFYCGPIQEIEVEVYDEGD